jgi:GNAT superfamily N-acetyltransferase
MFMNVKASIEIVEYSQESINYIKQLNYEWLIKYFTIESNDVLTLSDPKKSIIYNGGLIYYAKHNGNIVGTAALLRINYKVYELAKMAVTEQYQGEGIGKMLLEHCLAVAKSNNIETLILYSNTILKSAINLYRKYGFEEVELEVGQYKRANIKMKKMIQ